MGRENHRSRRTGPIGGQPWDRKVTAWTTSHDPRLPPKDYGHLAGPSYAAMDHRSAWAFRPRPVRRGSAPVELRGSQLDGSRRRAAREMERKGLAQSAVAVSGWKTNQKTSSATDCRPARKIPSSHLDQPTSTSCILSRSI